MRCWLCSLAGWDLLSYTLVEGNTCNVYVTCVGTGTGTSCVYR